MNLTLTFAGSRQRDGSLSYSWSLDDDSGTRIAEQCGDVCGYQPAEATARTAAWEGLLAGLEWLLPVQMFATRSLRVACSAVEADELARPAAADDDSARARCGDHLRVLRRRGVAVAVGRAKKGHQPAGR